VQKKIMDPPEASKEPSKSALKKAAKQAQMAADKAAKAAKQTAMPVQIKASKSGGGDEIIGITASKETDFPAWYQEVVLKAEMIEYYNEISGFFILMPTAMYIWKIIHSMCQVLCSRPAHSNATL
jgi:prolyl-tRNA synthetase